MGLVLSNEIKSIIDQEISLAFESVQIISAFCKISALKYIDTKINSSVKEKKLLVRYRLSDITYGATDFELFEFCKMNNWNMYFRLDMHAKTYVFDRRRCLLGSANLTEKGLNINGFGNYELANIFPLDINDFDKIQKIYETAVLMNDELYSKMKAEMEIGCGKGNAEEWSEEILQMFDTKIETLFSYELPDKPSPFDYQYQTIDFLELEAGWSLKDVKMAYRYSKSIIWLRRLLETNGGEMYFGEISSHLQNALISDPKPYRKDVKVYLQNILNWIQELELDIFVIDRPNYSQRVMLVKL